MVRWIVFTDPMRSARSPLEKSRKKRAGADTTRSTSAACIATPMRDSNRITASERSTSSVMMETPATASAATIAWIVPVSCAGIDRSMSHPVAAGVNRPTMAATNPAMRSSSRSGPPCATVKRSMSMAVSARRSKRR